MGAQYGRAMPSPPDRRDTTRTIGWGRDDRVVSRARSTAAGAGTTAVERAPVRRGAGRVCDARRVSDAVLRIADLRAALSLALDAFEAEHGPELPVARDLYWHLPVDASFDLSRRPGDDVDLTVGQVSDDLAEVRGFLADGDAGPVWHALQHAIGLLRVLEDAARP